MSDLTMPTPRNYGWVLKPTSSTQFEIINRDNGQFCVVLNHALLRGVTAEMIHWWFLNFPNLRVRLRDVPQYEGSTVPGYLLWHPSDHINATLSGSLGPGGTSRAGASIGIQEAMQYERYGLTYPVDTTLKILYCEPDGWSMGKVLPIMGKAMVLSIRYQDVVRDGVHMGVHYHYEIVVGVSGRDPVSKALNRKITGDYTTDFFSAWHTHNAIEVGTFENFLPALWAQRSKPDDLQYGPDMNAAPDGALSQTAQGPDLFARRTAGYRSARNPYEHQNAEGSLAF
ncbi:MAG: hypothetical protein AAFR35_12490 [Pseudomonadota bacterium]